jgi:hypothetical protein
MLPAPATLMGCLVAIMLVESLQQIRRLAPFFRHCEERSDEAIQPLLRGLWIASLRSQ